MKCYDCRYFIRYAQPYGTHKLFESCRNPKSLYYGNDIKRMEYCEDFRNKRDMFADETNIVEQI